MAAGVDIGSQAEAPDLDLEAEAEIEEEPRRRPRPLRKRSRPPRPDPRAGRNERATAAGTCRRSLNQTPLIRERRTKERPMAEITAALVKELREKTGAGMMDCKKALAETAGDIEAAVDWLRKKGLSAAAKKSGRVAAEGLVGVAAAGTRGAVVEVNAETDFVARNELFQGFVRQVAERALATGGDIEALKAADAIPASGRTMADELTHLIATIGENMALRRALRLEVSQGVVASYVHNATATGLGKIGVLVALESAGDTAKLEALGRQLAMHVAAANPQSLDVASVDTTALDRERDVLREQARASGKAEAIIDKMVEGRLRKYYEETVLVEQIFVVDGETRVSKVVEGVAKEIGQPIRVAGFARYSLGEGIEKAQSDFAAEVAAQLGR
jgi:elongation factor Ts